MRNLLFKYAFMLTYHAVTYSTDSNRGYNREMNGIIFRQVKATRKQVLCCL
jgi:hypothetical protein